jgi:hypothetical protein
VSSAFGIEAVLDTRAHCIESNHDALGSRVSYIEVHATDWSIFMYRFEHFYMASFLKELIKLFGYFMVFIIQFSLQRLFSCLKQATCQRIFTYRVVPAQTDGTPFLLSRLAILSAHISMRSFGGRDHLIYAYIPPDMDISIHPLDLSSFVPALFEYDTIEDINSYKGIGNFRSTSFVCG